MEDKMPNGEPTNRKGGSAPKSNPKALTRQVHTHESTAYLQGLFNAFQEHVAEYNAMTAHLLEMEARIELAEKTLSLTRDHLNMTINQTEGAAPHEWDKVLNSVRFVGVRLADACMALLQESTQKKLTPDELLNQLNHGMFRFRTNSPLREIHAALLKQSSVKRSGSHWVWTGKAEQLPLRLRVMKATPQTIEAKEVAG